MGFKKTLRSIEATSRRLEREAKRGQRELEKQQKQLEKLQQLELAKAEVEEYENYLDVIMSIHKDCGYPWDWEKIQSSTPPMKPIVEHEHEQLAQANLDEYKPSISDKLLKRVDSKREELIQAVKDARRRDKELYESTLNKYKNNYLEYQTKRDIAIRINEGDERAYIDAIKFINPFSEVTQIGMEIRYQLIKNKLIEIFIKMNNDEVIPRKVKKVLKSGKLSVKDMPKTKFYALYQDYVCSWVLRVAREVFAILPIELVLINAIGELLNSKTGQMEDKPILSVLISRKTIDTLNFEMLDPSDAMDNFVHNMKFLRLKGFQTVNKLDSSEFESLDA
jgi:hypothetical protein